MADRFSDKDQAVAYSKYRTPCPVEVILEAIKYLKEKYNGNLKRAVDVGCGTGCSTLICAPYFDEVLGTDLSDAQLEHARSYPHNPPNVKFMKSPAEELPFLEDNSVQLITVSHALHWFDLDRFFAEVKRVLVPNGVLLVWRDHVTKIIVYDPQKSEELTNLFMKFRFETAVPYWDTRNFYANQSYSGIDFPFKDVLRNEKYMYLKKNIMKDQIEWYYSWSPYQKMKEDKPELAEKEINHMKNRSEEILGTLDIEITTEMKGALILCRQ